MMAEGGADIKTTAGEDFSVCAACDDRFFNPRKEEEISSSAHAQSPILCPLCRQEDLDAAGEGRAQGRDEVEGRTLEPARSEVVSEIHRRFSRSENLAVLSRLKSASFRHPGGRPKVVKKNRKSKKKTNALQIPEVAESDGDSAAEDAKENMVKVNLPPNPPEPDDVIGNTGSSKFVKMAEVAMSSTVTGMVFDSESQTLVLRTLDTSGPLKVYDHNVTLVREFGKGITGLVKGNIQRRLALDTRRNLFLAPTENSILRIDKFGAMTSADTFKVGTDLCGVAYSPEEDLYAVSDVKENKIYVISPEKRMRLSEFTIMTSSRYHTCVPVHHVTLTSSVHPPDPVVVVSDLYSHVVRVYTVFGQQLQALGSRGSGEGQLVEPRGVGADGEGRVLVCDWYNRRVVGYRCGGEGEGVAWECPVLPEGFSRPRDGAQGRMGYPGLLTVDTTHNLVAVRANMNGHRIYMYRI